MESNGSKKFPGPYVNQCKESDPIMERVPLDTMDIGARKSGMPTSADAKSDGMGIKHVESGARK